MGITDLDDNDEKCACRGSFLDKLLQPVLLVVLSKGENHGFKIINDIKESGMVSGDSLDPAGLYRTLKRMESAGLVTSRWDVETDAKPKRIYAITEEGSHCLAIWKNTLTDYRNNIDNMIKGISEIVG